MKDELDKVKDELDKVLEKINQDEELKKYLEFVEVMKKNLITAQEILDQANESCLVLNFMRNNPEAKVFGIACPCARCSLRC